VHCADDVTFSNQREMSVIELDCLIVALFAGILLVFHFSLPAQPQATTPNRTATCLNRTSTALNELDSAPSQGSSSCITDNYD
jgi:hypothetical protein